MYICMYVCSSTCRNIYSGHLLNTYIHMYHGDIVGLYVYSIVHLHIRMISSVQLLQHLSLTCCLFDVLYIQATVQCTQCAVHMLCAQYTCCVRSTHAVCAVHMLCAQYTCCVRSTHAVCAVHMLCAEYTHVVCGVHMLHKIRTLSRLFLYETFK